MDVKEASWRILGAEDFIRLFVKALDNIGKLKQEDKNKLLLMLNDLRLVMVIKYQKGIKDESKQGRD
jgi:hypothetical protein